MTRSVTLVHHHYVGISISPQLKPGMLHSDCDIDFSTDHMLVEIHQSHSRDPDPSGSQQEGLRDTSAKTRATLLDLFALGYGASTALSVLWYISLAAILGLTVIDTILVISMKTRKYCQLPTHPTPP